MRRTLLAAMPLLLASCSGGPETKAYFTKATGISLCEAATVHNVTPAASDQPPAIYVADVHMPDSGECNGMLFGGLENRTGKPCAPTIGCAGRSPDGASYRLDMIPGGWRVTFKK